MRSRVVSVVAASAAAGFLLCSAARAGDGGPAEDFDWTGFYAGAFTAGGIGTSEAAFGDLHPVGVFGGIDAGAQYQFDRFIIGIEGNASLSDLDHDKGQSHTPSFQTQDMDNIGSVRARLGAAVGSNMMVFTSAGWGWADTEYGEGTNIQKHKVDGLSLGGGVHYAWSKHLIGRAEYIHYFYGDTTYDLASPTTVENSADEIRLGVDYKF